MSKTINTGWLTDFEDVYFAPKTLFTKVLHDNSGTDLLTYLTTLENNTNIHELVVDLGEDGKRTFSSGILGVQGTLDVPNGGTGHKLLTSHYLLIGNGADDVTLLAPAEEPTWLLASDGTSKDPKYKALTNSWITDTGKGPSLQIEVGGAAACQAQIPTATDSQSGVVIVGEQTFGGKKIFNSGIDLNNQEITSASGISFPDNTYYFVDSDDHVIAYIDGNGIHAVNFITKDSNNVKLYDINEAFDDIYTTLGSTISNAFSKTGTSDVSDYMIKTRDMIIGIHNSLRGINLKVDLASNSDITLGDAQNKSLIGVIGTLDVPNGGTGLNSIAKHNLLVGNDTGTVSLIAPLSSNDSKINTYVLANNNGVTPSYKAITNSWYGGDVDNLSLQIEIGGTAACAAQIPHAGVNTSGVVAKSAQIFGGTKTFQDGIDVNNTEITRVAGMQYTNASTFYFVDNNENVIAYVNSNGVQSTNFITKDGNTVIYNMNNDFDNIYRILGSDIDAKLNAAAASTIAEYIAETRTLISSNDTNIRNIGLWVNLASNDSTQVGNGANNIGVFNQLDVENGGTGQASLTNHNLLVGNGTSKVKFIAPLTGNDSKTNTYVLANNNSSTPSYKAITAKWYGGSTDNLNVQILVGGTSACAAQIPNAGVDTAGIVTKSAQTFGGKKTFNDSIDVNNKEITHVAGMQYTDHTFYFTDDSENVVAYVNEDGVNAIDFITKEYSFNKDFKTIYETSLKVNLASNDAVSVGAASGGMNIGVTGTLDVPNGGTGNTSFTESTLIYAKTAGQLSSYTADCGNKTTPFYLAAGVPTACSPYAGGTKITINGTDRGASTASFYAPTTGGTAGYILRAGGDKKHPSWIEFVPVDNGGTGTTDRPTRGGIIYGESATKYASTAAGTTGQLLQSNAASAPTWITATNSNTGSTIVKRDSDGNFSAGTITADLTGTATKATKLSTGYGDSKTPVYFASDGTPTEGTNLDNYLTLTELGIEIPANADLDTYTTGGTYYSKDSGRTDTLTNAPVSGAGFKLIVICSYQAARCYQLLLSNSNQIWQRYYSNSAWGDWCKVWRQGNNITGAVWNDYAECRVSECEEAGYVLAENGDDTLSKTTERLAAFAGVSSDTWGFSQGQTDTAKTHIAVAGRVLAFTYQDRNKYKPGDCVCAAPDGTVDIMTREEIINFPDRIVGTVSCVPSYEEWGGGKNADRPSVKVNGRIWIKIK